MYTRQRFGRDIRDIRDLRDLRDTGGISHLTFDPGNDDRLHFTAASRPLISEGSFENGSEFNRKRRRPYIEESFGNLGMDSSSMALPVSDPSAWNTSLNNLRMTAVGMTGQPLLSDFDPGVGIMPGISSINPLMPGMDIFPSSIPPDMPVVKEIIHCKSCTLFPPNPMQPPVYFPQRKSETPYWDLLDQKINDLPPPATRERPPGCKTVFVGGLPENATDQIVSEIFEQCGEIIAIRKSKKNFCHIRFVEELTVDKALYLSGYRIRLGSSTDKKDTGRLHVDYAQARDDFYEWECNQRMLAREERHRRKIEEQKVRPPSPPSVVHYSDHECFIVAEKLKDDSKFRESVQILLNWIERGEVNRRTANSFYSMIQSANSHIRRLINEKMAQEKEMEVAKENFMVALSGILMQFEQIVAVFHSACKQKAWDHFTKAQRKNIGIWCKQAEEIRNVHSAELMGIRREEEMEMSDEEPENPAEAKETEQSALQAQADALKEENDSLRWQLDAYRNEIELLKQEHGSMNLSDEDVSKDEQLSTLQQALQGMQQQETTDDEREGDPNQSQENETVVSTVCVSSQDDEERLPETFLERISRPVKSEREALLVGIISTFLHVHPFGASIEYICSYLQRLDSKISTSEVEIIMSRLQHTFKQELSGVGASLEKRWKFCGFEGLKMT